MATGEVALPPDVSVRDTVGEIWQTFTRRAGRIFLIAALPIVPLDIAVAVLDPDYTDVEPSWTGYVTATVVLYLVAVPLATAAIVAYLDDERHGQASIGRAFGHVDRLGTLAVATFLYNLCTAAAALLLIVPGLLLAARWVTYIPAIVLAEEGPIGGLAHSNRLVRGTTWTVVGVGLLILLITFGLAIVPVAIGAFWDSVYGAILFGVGIDLATVPLFAVTAYVIYRRLTLD